MFWKWVQSIFFWGFDSNIDRLSDFCFVLFDFWLFRAAAVPMAKGGAYLQMKLVYNQLAPIVLFLLQWMDCSCTCLLPRYLNLFHILVHKVCWVL